jgi:uncharacterized protein YcfL
MPRNIVAAAVVCLVLCGCSETPHWASSATHPFQSDNSKLAAAVKADPFPTAAQSQCPPASVPTKSVREKDKK